MFRSADTQVTMITIKPHNVVGRGSIRVSKGQGTAPQALGRKPLPTQFSNIVIRMPATAYFDASWQWHCTHQTTLPRVINMLPRFQRLVRVESEGTSDRSRRPISGASCGVLICLNRGESIALGLIAPWIPHSSLSKSHATVQRKVCSRLLEFGFRG
ncbi:hypothetical protein BJV78DRAFT_1179992 [Lactifluus subvellereus]|nr:hypothetical protein BJV78DRAFT_1179992 [Lactifluus subvellereus]